MAGCWDFIVFVFIVLCHRDAFAALCPMRVVRIKNGDYYMRSSNTVVSFTCNSGFSLLGPKQLHCFGGQWSSDPPICITNSCQKISESAVMRIQESYGGAMLKFSCSVMHKLEGTDTLVCDGVNWSANPPNCAVWAPPMSCDFENPDLCGWSHHDEDDQEWRWNTGATKTTRTGPSHDHTLGAGDLGHYMYFETSSPTRTGHQAWLSSPLYPTSYSDGYCFQFWYHSLGSGSIGTLEVFIKPEFTNLTDATRMFYLNTSIGDQWQRELVPVVKQPQPYQFFFVATRGSGYRSDFAIDDVALKKCSEFTATTQGMVITRSSTRKPTTIVTSTTVPTIITTSTAKSSSTKPTTVTTPTTKPISTKKPTTLRITTKPPTKQTSTPPSTKVKLTPLSTRKSTNKSKTTPKTTVSKITTRAPAVKSTSMTGSKDSTVTSQVLTQNSGNGDSSTSKVAYILVGVGICICLAIAVGIGLFIYNRRRKQIYWSKDSPFVADNPLYRVVASDDSAVQFASMNEN